MLDRNLELAVGHYQLEPTTETASRLCFLLLEVLPLTEDYRQIARIFPFGQILLLAYREASLFSHNRVIIFSDYTKGPILCLIKDKNSNQEGGRNDIIYSLSQRGRLEASAREDIPVGRITRQINYALSYDWFGAATIKEVELEELESYCREEFICRLKLLLDYVSKHPEDIIAPMLAAETYFHSLMPPKTSCITVEWDPDQRLHSKVQINTGFWKILIREGRRSVAAILTDKNECYHIPANLLKLQHRGISSVNGFLKDNLKHLRSVKSFKQFNCYQVEPELMNLLLN